MITFDPRYSPSIEPSVDPEAVAEAVALVTANRERIMATLTSQRASGQLKGRPQLPRPDELVLELINPELLKSLALLEDDLDRRQRVHELRQELESSREVDDPDDLPDIESAEVELELARKWEIHSYSSTGDSPLNSCDESGFRLRMRDQRIQAEAKLDTARKQKEVLLSSVSPLVRDCVARRLRRLEDSDVGRAVDDAESRVKAAEEAVMMYDVTFGSQHPISTCSWDNEAIKAAWLPYLTAHCPQAIHNEPDGAQTIDGDVVGKHVSVLRTTGIGQLRFDLYSRQISFRCQAEKAARVETLWAGDGRLDLAALRELLREDVAVDREERYDPLF